MHFLQDDDTAISIAAHRSEELQRELKEWHDQQATLNILLTTPTVLLGYRVSVYRPECTTQWYTAVVCDYDDHNKVSLLFRLGNGPLWPFPWT